MSDVVVIRGLHKRFGNVQALAGVDLTIPAGSTFGLVGPNGAGKTTLFSILSGFLRPSAGTVEVLGVQRLDGRPVLRGRISVLPQDAAFRRGTPIGFQLALLARLQGMDAAAAIAETQRVLRLTDMVEAVQRSPDTLSHGMRKRISIAQALIGDPELVILDEPLAGLDPAQAKRLRLLIQGEAGKRTFIISSHAMADIETLCTHVAILKAGRLLAQPSLDELTHREGVVVFTLEVPPSPELARKIEALPFVKRVEIRAVERKLQISVRAEENLDEACAKIIHVLMEEKTAFIGMQKGTSLEDAILKIT